MIKKILFLLILVLSCNVLSAQDFKKVKVTLSNGVIVEGKKGTMSNESFSFIVLDNFRTYPINEIQMIQAKRGLAGKMALGFGGGCAGLVIITGVITGADGIEDLGSTTGQYVLGGVLWTGIFTGVGALIGVLADSYETVYIKRTSSILKNFNIYYSSNQFTGNNLSLAYKIPIR